MLARAFLWLFADARRYAGRLLRGTVLGRLRGAGVAGILALLLAACAPALSAAPAVTATDAAAEQTGTSVVVTPADAATTDPQAAPSAVTSPSDPPAGGAALAAGVQVGLASWYGPNFAGRLTSDGEIFDPSKLTAAHRTLPFGTLVKVTNLVNGRSVVVRINDRGPYKANRIIDLSRAAAEAIDMVRMGVAKVRLEPLSLPNGVVRLGVGPQLQHYQVLSRFHHVGQLLVLSKRNGADAVVVRVVGTDVPPSTGADVLVSSELYALIGAQAHVQVR
ncbi:MAG: septal ring lytic transglycosylase RlpA family protein [Deinococcales bacterium]